MHYHISDFHTFLLWFLMVERSVQPYALLSFHSFFSEAEQQLSWGKSSEYGIPNCLNVFKNDISTEIPCPISVFFHYTIGDFNTYHNQIILNQVYFFEIHQSKGNRRQVQSFVMFTDRTYCRCLFWAEPVAPPPANPSAMVLMTCLS